MLNLHSSSAVCFTHHGWSGFPCLFAIFIFFKGRWFTLWAIVGRLLLSLVLFWPYSLSFHSLFYTISLILAPSTLSLHIFLDRFTMQASGEEESRLDAPFARQLRGRIRVRAGELEIGGYIWCCRMCSRGDGKKLQFCLQGMEAGYQCGV